jgi:hypothetical protein
VGQLVVEEKNEHQLFEKKLMQNNKLNLYIDEETKKPEKREMKPLNYEFKPQSKRIEYSVGLKKDFKAMTYEERILEIDKNVKLNAEILYNNRFNILKKNYLVLNGNDIIFPVPKIDPIGKVPPVQENKKHRIVAKVLEKTKLDKSKKILQLKDDDVKKKKEYLANIEIAKKTKLPGLTFFNE